jgi:phenylacetate-CoA ligase
MIWNQQAETMPSYERRALQARRLSEIVRWAVDHVEFYRRQVTRPIERLEDLSSLPFTRKTDLRDHYPFGLFAVPRRELVRLHASSGTKGKPTIVGYTPEDLDVWREVMARIMVAAGARPGHTLHNAYGYGLFTGGLGFHDGGERVGMAVVPVSSGNTARHHLLLQDLRPEGLAATPSFALHIAESFAAAGGKPQTLGVRYGMFGAEPWTEAMRAALERAWGCPAYDVYGLSEITGPGVAGECEARDGLHVTDDHFLPEIVDPATGGPCGEGVQGELVLTTLTKRALPMLRYRTGDITALTTSPCRCGRTSARIARLKGRADDMLVIKGVNVYPSEVEAALLAVDGLEPHYQLVVDRRATLARVEIHVEPSGGRSDDEALRRRIAERVKTAIGLTVDVHLAAPMSLPRSEGKAVRVRLIDSPP